MQTIVQGKTNRTFNVERYGELNVILSQLTTAVSAVSLEGKRVMFAYCTEDFKPYLFILFVSAYEIMHDNLVNFPSKTMRASNVATI